MIVHIEWFVYWTKKNIWNEQKHILLEECSRASPLDESKLWLLRSKEGEALGLVGMGTLGMLGALTRFGMLLRNLSNGDRQTDRRPHRKKRTGFQSRHMFTNLKLTHCTCEVRSQTVCNTLYMIRCWSCMYFSCRSVIGVLRCWAFPTLIHIYTANCNPIKLSLVSASERKDTPV